MNFSEQLIASALQRQGYFIVQGLKAGLKEADFLTIRKLGTKLELAHIEAQISFRPIGILSAKPKLGSRSKDHAKEARSYIQKKFYDKKLCKEISNIFDGKEYKRIFIHGILRDYSQLDTFREEGIECWSLSDLINRAEKSKNKIGAFTDFFEVAKLYSKLDK